MFQCTCYFMSQLYSGNGSLLDRSSMNFHFELGLIQYNFHFIFHFHSVHMFLCYCHSNKDNHTSFSHSQKAIMLSLADMQSMKSKHHWPINFLSTSLISVQKYDFRHIQLWFCFYFRFNLWLFLLSIADFIVLSLNILISLEAAYPKYFSELHMWVPLLGKLSLF